jgi:hypothetical protein
MIVRRRRCSTARASLAEVGATPLELALLGGSCAGGDSRILARITGSSAHLYGENRNVREADDHAYPAIAATACSGHNRFLMGP